MFAGADDQSPSFFDGGEALSRRSDAARTLLLEDGEMGPMRRSRCVGVRAPKPNRSRLSHEHISVRGRVTVVAPDANFIWSIADMLRGPYRPKEYGTVVLPFTVLARFEALLKPTKDKVLTVAEKVEGRPPLALQRQMLRKASGQSFYNTSPYSLSKLGDQNQLAANLTNLIDGYDPEVREVFEKFEMYKIIQDLDERDRLPTIVKRFASLDMNPEHVTNEHMGHVFEELIRRFMEASKDTAGEFFAREVIRLMVSLLFSTEDDTISDEHALRQVYDPTCGTGGMLSAAHEWLAEHNPQSATHALRAGG